MADGEPVSFEGHIPTEEALGQRMLPFEVPSDTAQIDISYGCQSDLSFGLQPDENPQDYVADIAVFDPRGAEFMGKGYRGSSGNSRDAIFIAPDDATPGYTPGTIQAGQWTLMLRFYKIAPTGTDYQATIRLTPGNSQSTSVLPARLPLRTTSDRPANATGWYRGELHCHTFHSDGDSDPRDVIRNAEQRGLDFLSITDHNTFSHQRVMNQVETDLILIPGCEVTTFRGHWNIWGEGDWIDFRVDTQAEMETTIKEAVRQGYLTSCNHPRPEGPPWRFPDAEGYDCVEVWNGPWESLNDVCLAFWETRINQGKRLIAVGGSDCHMLHPTDNEMIGQPTTFIYCPGEPSAAGILNGLRAGHAFVTRLPDGPQLYLTSGMAMMGDVLEAPESGMQPVKVRVVGGDGMTLELRTVGGTVAQKSIIGDDVTLDFEVAVTDALYVRAQLRDNQSGNCTAVTNPIYFRDTIQHKPSVA